MGVGHCSSMAAQADGSRRRQYSAETTSACPQVDDRRRTHRGTADLDRLLAAMTCAVCDARLEHQPVNVLRGC